MSDETDFEQEFSELISTINDPLRQQLANAVGIFTIAAMLTWLAVIAPCVVLMWRLAF